MTIGTKSVLYGAHCFLLHWLFVALGWWKLYGWRKIVMCPDPACRECHWRTTSLRDPRLWLLFFVHDLGYLGKPNMDGPEGEQHPFLGARIMGAIGGRVWFNFALYHSRFLAKQRGHRPSPFCLADKLAIALEPWWLYLPRVNLTGEVREYMAKSSAMNATGNKYSGMNLSTASQRAWNRDMVAYIRRWVDAHKDGREDTWTPDTKEAITETGVWK